MYSSIYGDLPVKTESSVKINSSVTVHGTQLS